uniref:NADH dehydrogenase subunit 4 n=1 Tax=Sambus kanssuensis TaxID=3045898 RepID=UPI00257D06EE|nr:NADH dehydrogenase subunit 4 [Sambus kanssuensis]WHE42542.1 NADH dehydrogenase subunit 4 [Sambus kanssuensis]
MMKLFISLFFMIPLFFSNFFWLFQSFLFFITFFFLLNLGYSYLYVNVSSFMGLDLLSSVMILLSLWICSLMVLASSKLFNTFYYFNLFNFTILMLLISLIFTFCSLNLFIFYLFFEVSLIPTLILILGWGYQPERLQAGFYLFFYTLFASLPMLISIFYLYSIFNSLDFYFLFPLDNWILMFCMNFVFLIKMPMYLVHLWLPKAHVEAPVSGSMILAGIMLKLGGYGFLRVLKIYLNILNSFNYILISISLMGGLIVSLICLRQVDIKSLIAYSSVSHMGLVLGGIMTFSSWGFEGSLVMMVAHGLSSSALFCLANMNYERLSSRSIYLNKGLMNLIPSLSLWWFLFSACNMAAPPSLNLLGEIMLINSLVSWDFLSMGFLMPMSFLSACYSLYLYSHTQHGAIPSSLMSISPNYISEYLLLTLHWIPLNFLILKSDLVSMFI